MLANLFALIQLILKVLSLWEGLLDSIEQADIAKREERRQAREKALEQLQNATSEDEFDKAQDSVVDNQSRP